LNEAAEDHSVKKKKLQRLFCWAKVWVAVEGAVLVEEEQKQKH
jgi:hypothetical protein